MYWKARIGSISPSVFEALPHDFYKVAPDRVLQVGVACMVQDWKDDEYEKALAKVDDCVRGAGAPGSPMYSSRRRAAGNLPRVRL